ncbi:MAG TPA: putative cytokinetic ring protein SteA [Limnochordales bacterium]
MGARGRPCGPARVDCVSKRLALRLRPGDVAVICHEDLDASTARMLAERRPAAVVDALAAVTGTRPARGAALLLEAGIPVLDRAGRHLLQRVQEGQRVALEGERLVDGRGRELAAGRRLGSQHVQQAQRMAQQLLPSRLAAFAANTLQRAAAEAYLLEWAVAIPPLSTRLAGRPAVVAVRSAQLAEDLRALAPFRERAGPVCIGVDGGADGLLEAGWGLDLVVGDMDSASDRALTSGAELVVQAYPDGRAPGMARVRRLGLFAHLFPCPGTSEDAALLLAAEAGACPVVVVGSCATPAAVLEKGRAGMGSTLLVRMRLGERLVDATGLSSWWVPAHPHPARGRWVAAAAMVPLGVLGWVSDSLQVLLKLVWLELQAGWRVGFGP